MRDPAAEMRPSRTMKSFVKGIWFSPRGMSRGMKGVENSLFLTFADLR